MHRFGTKHTLELLDQMLDAALEGRFRESDYNETELSRLETKWMRFLSISALNREKLEQERSSIQGLVSDISHQLKTPLANLRLYEDILDERLEGDDRELIRHLIHETELLEFLIQSLVKISRLETGTIQLSAKDQPVAPLIRDALERAEAKRSEKNVSFDIRGCDKEIRARFDRKWTAEALYNILDNAVKYTPSGSCVTIRAEEYPMFARIRVSDQGPGVTEDEIPHLFERFYRSPRFHEKEGVGLGLSLAREIIRKEGGYIKVSPKSDAFFAESESGADFSIFLRKS